MAGSRRLLMVDGVWCVLNRRPLQPRSKAESEGRAGTTPLRRPATTSTAARALPSQLLRCGITDRVGGPEAGRSKAQRQKPPSPPPLT